MPFSVTATRKTKSLTRSVDNLFYASLSISILCSRRIADPSIWQIALLMTPALFVALSGPVVRRATKGWRDLAYDDPKRHGESAPEHPQTEIWIAARWFLTLIGGPVIAGAMIIFGAGAVDDCLVWFFACQIVSLGVNLTLIIAPLETASRART